MAVQTAFFAEQMGCARTHGGVPRSLLGRSYAGIRSDVADVPASTNAKEVWLDYEGVSPLQETASAYRMRHLLWDGPSGRRALIRLRLSDGGQPRQVSIEPLPPGREPPLTAYLISPWTGPQQRNGQIPRRP